jgi:hypothetical protein
LLQGLKIMGQASKAAFRALMGGKALVQYSPGQASCCPAPACSRSTTLHGGLFMVLMVLWCGGAESLNQASQQQDASYR